MICEDVNIAMNAAYGEGNNIKGDNKGGGCLAAPPDLGMLIALGGDLNEIGNRSLFFVPASTQPSVFVLEQQPQVWQPPMVFAQEVVPPSGESNWADQGPPRLVRRGVGGLIQRQTVECTLPPGEPKCLFKWAASIPSQSIYPGTPSLMYREMGAGMYDGGYESGSDESTSTAASSPGVVSHQHQSWVHGSNCSRQLAGGLKCRVLQPPMLQLVN